MIKINVISVGKIKEKYLKDACAEYLKRLMGFAKVNVIEVGEFRSSDNPSSAEIEQVKQKEGEAIIAKIPKGSFVISMCIEGGQLSSEELSQKLSSITLNGISEITFIIGGSFGLSDEVKTASDLRLSFGKITLPHQLMRVVLLEQIYRAFTIMNNTKYHK